MHKSPPSAGSQSVLAPPAQRRNAAFYAAPVEAFLAASDEEAYAPLAAPHGYTLAPEQLSAWRLQLPVLRTALADLPARAFHCCDAFHSTPKALDALLVS